MFLRLGAAIDEVGAKRVVIDTIETMFGACSNTALLRGELHRLFRWLKGRGVTAVITAERGDGTLTRYGIEEYVSDCVIVLDHRVSEQASTRRLRILKYRGSLHGTNEYPFLIGDSGMSVLPITAHGLQHGVSSERVSTGVARLDAMLGDGGFFKGGTVLVSGTAGTGKSTLAAQFCDAACSRGERGMYFAFEESEAEIIRNMGSVGIDLRRWRCCCHVRARRSSDHGSHASWPAASPSRRSSSKVPTGSAPPSSSSSSTTTATSCPSWSAPPRSTSTSTATS